jgi:mRNA interferase HigB
MHIITRSRLTQFSKEHPDAESSLKLWYTLTKRAAWNNLVAVKRIFPHADQVGRLTVFNVGGNKYRLIVRIEYVQQAVYIRHILTHAEYDKESWKHDPWY